jgi:hypothetical protein
MSITGQPEKGTVSVEAIFWDCPVMNFRMALPFHGM